MKWKKQVWVFDNVIPKKHQEKIKSTLLGTEFPWIFVPDVTASATADKRPAFSHSFVKDGIIHPLNSQQVIKMLETLWESALQKMYEKTGVRANYSISRARTFLQVPLRNVAGGEYDSHHIDIRDEHFAMLYYVCDADGDTVIFENMFSPQQPAAPQPHQLKEKIRVTPKQGRLVIFDGYYWHTATQPTQNVRCVINTDVIVRKD